MKLYFFIICIVFNGLSFGQSITVSNTNRYLTKSGQPFIWIGDTAWELFHRCSKEDAEYYFKKRSSQGFTVVQAVILAELDGLHTPNYYGEKPFKNIETLEVNIAYFEHVNNVIEIANQYGITIALLPTWGDKIYKDTWGVGPEIFNIENAYSYGKWVGDWFKRQDNIIWVLGGDRNPRRQSDDVEVWRNMAKGLTDAYGHKDSLLLTFHPQPNKEGASEWFHNDDWLDFNMFQTGHCRDLEVYNSIELSYKKIPMKPVINGEPIYETHPVCFNAKDLGVSSAYDIRKAAYLSILSGAFGHTYGCHAVWQMYGDGFEGVNGPQDNWRNSLDLQGANQMKHLRNLLETKPIYLATPDQSVLLEKNLSAYERVQASSGKDFAVVYTALG
nr:DUF4038 domain-containing protein [Saprospiraceae bacterium]